MFGSELIGIIIALLLTFMTLSTLCSAINEWIAALTASRGRYLEAGIKSLLCDPRGEYRLTNNQKEMALLDQLANHPLIKGLTSAGPLSWMGRRFKWPLYLPPEHFSAALLDSLAPIQSATQGRTVADVLAAIDGMTDGDLKRTLVLLANASGNDLETLRRKVEVWYGEGMERVSGWYKRYTQIAVMIIAGCVSLLLNVDTLMMLRLLSSDPQARSQLVAAAEETVRAVSGAPGASSGSPAPGGKAPDTGAQALVAATQRLKDADARINSIPLPIGWSTSGDKSDQRKVPRSWDDWVDKIPGLAFSTIALSMGAPFYFDLLKKLINVRLTGVPPDERSR
jgi:hypothetical protein